jgi:hypothetical protein
MPLSELAEHIRMLMLNKNPLVDISHARAINTVILNGRVFGRDRIDAMLAAVENAKESSRKINIDEYR